MADLDILTLAEARSAINVPNTANTDIDTPLALMVSAVSQQIDELCGPVVARTVTEVHPGGSSGILLRTVPVISVTTVTETVGDATPLTLTTTDYLLEANGPYAFLHRRSNGYATFWQAGDFSVTVTFSAGRFANTAAVAAIWKQVTSSILKAQWQQEAGAWATSPNAFDEYENGVVTPFVSVVDMLQRRIPHEMLGPGIG